MRAPDAIVLAFATVLSVAAIASLPAQYDPVLFRHDTQFIGVALTLLAAAGSFVGWRVGIRGRGRVPGTPPVIVAVLTAVLALGGVFGYRLYDGIGWPRLAFLAVIVLPPALAWTALALGRRAAGWPRLLTALLSLPVVLVAAVVHGGASLALSGDPGGTAEHCVVRGSVRYCHFSGYRHFVDFWHPVVSAVLDAASASPERLQVQQTTEGVRPGGTGVAPLLEWGRGDTAPFALALDTAAWRTGAVPAPRHELRPTLFLEAQGARAIVIFWLAAQATPDTRTGFDYFVTKDACGDAVTGNDYVEAPIPTDGELHAAALLADVGAEEKVRAHWQTLIDLSTSLQQASELLEITPIPDQRPPC